ncbi:MAG: rhomboid family intramembrane serine protease [Paracoccaceae bacterium]|nr:rhomboid family intramembrane serine protease [Paracoccaceae bacterium]
MNPDYNAPPLNPLPPVVWLLALPIAAVEIVLGLGARGIVGGPEATGWRLAALQDYAFLDPVFDWMLENASFPPEYLMRFVTYPFVHGNFTHALLALVFLLALGKFVGEVFRAWALLAVFFAAAIVGALAYGLILDTRVPLFGAYPAIYGLIGAFTFILWARLGAMQADRRRAFLLIGFLMLFQLVFGIVNWLIFGSASFDWVADLAGFGAGFVLSFVVSPGGWAAMLARLRQP